MANPFQEAVERVDNHLEEEGIQPPLGTLWIARFSWIAPLFAIGSTLQVLASMYLPRGPINALIPTAEGIAILLILFAGAIRGFCAVALSIRKRYRVILLAALAGSSLSSLLL